MTSSPTKKVILSKGFTLIELLIVVAIIAILAAIAVPNFLEAQTRSKVSRCLADIRSLRVALEAYAVDHNHYPETDLGTTEYNSNHRISIDRVTTPVAFMTSIPRSPFTESFGFGGSPKVATVRNTVLYVRKVLWLQATDGRNANSANNNIPASAMVDTNYYTDRTAYLMATGSLPAIAGVGIGGEWMIKSVGPNNFDDRQTTPPGWGSNGRVYDATNGTASDGDIVVFSDISGTGKNQ